MGKIVGKGKVTIKPLAYYKMLLHVLRFGNKVMPQDQCVEVMSVLVGHIEGEGYVKDVIIEDAIPISHGSSVEVEFSINDYIYFEKVMNMFEQEGSNRFMVGWMHSHPNLFKFEIFLPSNSKMMSPRSNPSFHAGELYITLLTNTPPIYGNPN